MMQFPDKRRLAKMLSMFEGGSVVVARRSIGSFFKVEIATSPDGIIAKPDIQLSIIVEDSDWSIWTDNVLEATNESNPDIIHDIITKLLNRRLLCLSLSGSGQLYARFDRSAIRICLGDGSQVEGNAWMLIFNKTDNKAEAWTVKCDRSVHYWEGVRPQIRKRKQP